ncbi:MAG: glutathione S-transferase family protein [Pseudomonadota bacterium]
MQVTIHGTALSPWVRRLFLVCEEKGIEYDIVNVVPFGDPDPEFLKVSPLGKVPVLEFEGKHLPDSLAASVFLESLAAAPQLFPIDGWQRAWMLWLCDYLTTGLFAKVEVPLFIQRFVNPNFFQKGTDQAVVDRALGLLPQHFDYLEGQLSPNKAFLASDAISLADLTAGSIFVNMRHAREPVNAERWPLLSAYVERLHARPSFTKVLERESTTVGRISPLFAEAAIHP